MARMLKKLQQKPAPQQKKNSDRPKDKGYLLLGLVIFTATVTIAGWQVLSALNRAMYVLLSISILLTYASRYHGHRLTEVQHLIVRRVSFVTIGLAAALFFVELYQRYAA